MTTSGLPGLRGPDHIGFTVPDLDQAVAFFRDVIGCDYIYYGGEFGGNPEFMTRQLSVDGAAHLKYCFMRCANGANFEIFEYEAPDQAPVPPRNSDIGGHHVAFYVDDMAAAIAHLKANGVTVQGEPQYIKDGPSAGATWVYFLAPWGMQLELVSYPDGKAYAEDAPILLWDPRDPGG
jgi:catechol 2,3-dioxygenase-like lactoylglutathione lyase family enzyme